MPGLRLAAGLVAAAVLVAACGSGGTPAPTAAPATSAPESQAPATAAPASQAPAGTAAVMIESFAFNPQAITVAAGTAVTWTNKDSAPHTVTFSDGGASSGRLAQGDIFTRTFDKPDTFTYACSLHPSMTGTVVVGP